MKVYLTRRYWLSASHRLHSEKLSAAQNQATYGKCNNPYGHGHNYAVEVTVSGAVDPATGMICDLGGLDCVVQREVLDRFDHQNLNCVPEFRELVPTSENLCETIFHILQRSYTAARLEKVRIQETSMNSFEYSGDKEMLR